jgi:Protein of unknown function (DUF2971)
MEAPNFLYRFRPLQEELLDREMSALGDCYLYSPPFAAMNDPMEAFYEVGGPADSVVDALLSPSGKRTADLYRMLTEMIDGFALVSFAGTFEDLPMWAYYASNFAGMCLEFATAELAIGDFDGQRLRPVTYAKEPLSPLQLPDLLPELLEEAVIARISRKRVEWTHEKEWRYITAEVGPKYYLDDALRRVFLGPRIAPEFAGRICAVLADRPTEVLQGEVHGYELRFRTVKPATPLEKCERVGAGRFDLDELKLAEPELSAFLTVPFEQLVDECRRTVLHPNAEAVTDIYPSGNHKDAIYFHTEFKLRSGRTVCNTRYFYKKMRQLPYKR